VALVAGAQDGFRFCRMIHLGRFVHPVHLAPCDRESDGPGYDGQFYFAMAHDPFLTRPETAASLDDSLRYRRILYPLTAWVASGGQSGPLPYVLVLLNVAAATALIALGATAAVAAGRSAWWSLALAAFGGVWLPIARDLTEPLQLAFLAAGMLTGSAALTLVAGAAKETAGVAVITESVRHALRRDWRPAMRFGLGAAALAGWIFFVRFAVRGSAESSLEGQFLRPIGAPLIVLAETFGTDLERFLLTGLAFVTCLLAIARLVSVRDGAAIAGAAYAAIELGAGYDNWQEPLAVFRAMAGSVVLVYLSWCRARDRLGYAVIGFGAASGVTDIAFLVGRSMSG
jgi:hypothetical protein